ncbi:PAS domain S-box-containing protein/diguanylate cyclase (GGDEF) domain-containing protein [Blastococcus fimeti]|nr:PAS domain S-box-containing protein/diguanylate cyclase (GGDEF) domain-containing protein [Blastococcus fimeti]
MTALRDLPRRLRWTLALGLLGLALTVPFSSPDGTGMQWDELVLGSVALSSVWMVLGRIRLMDRRATGPWWPLLVGSLCFAVAQFLTAAFPGPAFDGFGVDDVVLLTGATSPLVTCALLARRVIRTRWTTLVVDGLLTSTALLVMTEVLRTPFVNPVGAPEDLRSLVLAYGGYAAVMLGGAGAFCTVSTRGLRRAATMMIATVTAQAAAAACEAMAIVAPSPLWTAASDTAVALALMFSALAIHRAPLHVSDRSARAAAPVVGAAGMSLVVIAMAGLPVALGLALANDQALSSAAEIGCGVIFALMALRLVLRIREDGRMTEDLVRSEEDFRELVEASSDGIAIMDARYRLLFTSPAARTLLGIDGDGDVSLLDVVRPEDRASVRTATEEFPAGEGAPLHFGVPTADGGSRELEATSSERPGSGRRVLYLRDVTTRRRRERELERMAYTDHLTRLANRAMLFQQMAADAVGERCLLVLDMDGFKAVNDVAGHEAGDQLLVEVARRLRTVVRDGDLIARLGGDEFAVLATGSMAEAEEVAGRIVTVMAMPHRVEDWTFSVGASVGVAPLVPTGGQLAFREADGALRTAKAAGKGCVRLATGDPLGTVQASEYYAARAEGRMSLRLDPVFRPDGGIDLVQAAPQWTHPTMGVLGGQEIWASAERHGRSTDLQSWLVRSACSEIAALPHPRMGVAISLPAGHVTVDGLAASVAAALADSGLAPERLVLSFTEETLLTSPAALVAELEAIRATGVRLCLDEYGMGYSLYALLARVSLDLVRVDLGALAAGADTRRALQVLAAIVRTTEGFGLDVVAGGITTPGLHEAALGAGVQLVHGRALPHDLTTDGLTELLAPV